VGVQVFVANGTGMVRMNAMRSTMFSIGWEDVVEETCPDDADWAYWIGRLFAENMSAPFTAYCVRAGLNRCKGEIAEHLHPQENGDEL
jgi:hypothetical protein